MAGIGIEEHRTLARWAADCAEHVLPSFAASCPDDPRPAIAVAAARAWAAGELPVGRARSAAFAAHAAAREAPHPAARAAARAAGHAAATAHVPDHARHAAAFAVKAAARSAEAALARGAAAAERAWQEDHLPDVLAPQRARLLGGSPASADAPATQRLFVALWPSPAAVTHLSAALDAGRPGGQDLRWQPPERWHITVAFLGDVDPTGTGLRLAAVPLDAAGPMRLEGSGTFGPVLWIGVDHGDWLPDLAARVRAQLRVDDGLFRPHVTVARGRGRAAIAVARDAAPVLDSYRGPAWIPEAVTLVRSRTGPHPHYQVIASWPLPQG